MAVAPSGDLDRGRRAARDRVPQAETEHAWTALGIGAAIALLFLGFGPGLAALLVAGLVGFAMIRLARARIGGYTGDILGAIEQLGEIAVLLAAAALL